MEKFDYYYSHTALMRHLRLAGMFGEKHTQCRFKGQVFVEAIKHGGKPLTVDDDLELIGTGTNTDCTYITR